MRVHVEVNSCTIHRLIVDYIKTQLPQARVAPSEVKIHLVPIRIRRKHPRGCPIQSATVETHL